jgi:uncharacterized protein (DUF58 family)
MSLRPAISAPLPWLTRLPGKLLKWSRDSKGKRRGLLKFPRTLKATREGKWYMGVLLVIGVAAMNTGNNLLYLVVATLLSLIVISGIMSESTLRGIRAQRRLPPLLFKGAPARISLKVTNEKKLFPSYSFTVTEIDGPTSGAYLLKLGPGESAEISAEYTFKRRGPLRLSGLKVETRFPFGLFTKGKEELVEEDALVLPSVSGQKLPVTLRAPRSGNADTFYGKGGGGGLWGMREYTLADDARHIHWKSAARSRGLHLKEFEKERDEKVVVLFDNRGPAGEEFERMVDVAAATVNRHIESGFSVGLRTASSDIPPAPGRDQLLRLLNELALISPESGQGAPSVKVVSL